MKIISYLMIWFIYEFKIIITEPKDLDKEIKKLTGKEELNYTLSLFGRINYWESKKITLIFDENNLFGCNNFDKKLYENYSNYGFIIKHGICSLELKSKNTEKAGGIITFMYLDDKNININNVIPKVMNLKQEKIPLVLWEKEVSLYIIGVLKTKKIVLDVSFDLNGKSKEDIVNLEFLMALENKKSYNFLKNFSKYYFNFGKKLNFKPIYKLDEIITNGSHHEYSEKYCIDHGKYCIYNDSEISKFISKKEIFYEIMRQICLFDLSQVNKKSFVWWEYIQNFHEICIQNVEDQKINSFYQCSKNLLENYKDLNFQTIDNCSKDSFSNKTVNIDSKNNLLEKYSNKQLDNDKETVDIIPLVVIDGYILKGNISSKNTMTAICDKLIDKPYFCNNFNLELREYYNEDKEEKFSLKIFIILFLALLFFFTCLYFIIFKYVLNQTNGNLDKNIKNYISEYNKLKNIEDNKDENL